MVDASLVIHSKPPDTKLIMRFDLEDNDDLK